MKNNCREFLKLSGLVGAVILAGGVNPGSSNAQVIDGSASRKAYIQKFNMSGYAAPKLDTVRLGFIGLGNRGPTHLQHATKLEGVEIKALCDLRPEKVASANKLCQTAGFKPETYTGKEDEWKKLCDRKDIDLVYIATPWHLHVPMALYAMEQGKHVAVEVPVAKKIGRAHV